MLGNRVAAETIIFKYIEAILPKSTNVSLYKTLFASFDDTQFEEFITKLEDGSSRLAIVAPNFGEPKLSVERNLDLAEKLGHNFFERIWIDEGGDVPAYLSPIPYLIVDLPLRRQAQILVKKISIPEDNKSVDDFTGQPTGKSKGSRISYPEIQVLAAFNLEQSLIEMLKARGGDEKMHNAFNTAISRTGGVSLDAIDTGNTRVKSTTTLKTMLISMHLSNTL